MSTYTFIVDRTSRRGRGLDHSIRDVKYQSFDIIKWNHTPLGTPTIGITKLNTCAQRKLVNPKHCM